jgi:hypothetical protein
MSDEYTRPALDVLCSRVIEELNFEFRREPVTQEDVHNAIQAMARKYKLTVDRPVKPVWLVYPAVGFRAYVCSVCNCEGTLYPESPLPSCCIHCGVVPTNAGTGAPS